MSDDECIAFAMLHCGMVWRDTCPTRRTTAYWFFIDQGYNEYSTGPAGAAIYDFDLDRAKAARKYLKRHGLLPEAT